MQVRVRHGFWNGHLESTLKLFTFGPSRLTIFCCATEARAGRNFGLEEVATIFVGLGADRSQVVIQLKH
jgi:hypothetical protein